MLRRFVFSVQSFLSWVLYIIYCGIECFDKPIGMYVLIMLCIVLHA